MTTAFVKNIIFSLVFAFYISDKFLNATLHVIFEH